jgi:hypothetical protein
MCRHRSSPITLSNPEPHDNRRPAPPEPEPEPNEPEPDEEATQDDAACVDPACCGSACCVQVGIDPTYCDSDPVPEPGEQVCAEPAFDKPACHTQMYASHADPSLDVEQVLYALQGDIGKIDALIYTTEQHFERFSWRHSDGDAIDEGNDPLNHLAYLIELARTAARAAVRQGNALARALVRADAAADGRSA